MSAREEKRCVACKGTTSAHGWASVMIEIRAPELEPAAFCAQACSPACMGVAIQQLCDGARKAFFGGAS